MSLTTLERQYLKAVLECEFQECEPNDTAVINNPVWSNCVYHELGSQAGGVAASLKKKGYLRVSPDGIDTTCAITRAGFEEYHNG